MKTFYQSFLYFYHNFDLKALVVNNRVCFTQKKNKIKILFKFFLLLRLSRKAPALEHNPV
jgi:hypothetical protein